MPPLGTMKHENLCQSRALLDPRGFGTVSHTGMKVVVSLVP